MELCLKAYQRTKLLLLSHNRILSSRYQLPAGQQVGPQDWELCDKATKLLKPLLLATKACEGDNISVSEVIPWIKKLNHEINGYVASGVGTLKSSSLAEKQWTDISS